MSIFKKIFKKKPGGTAVGNFLRDVFGSVKQQGAYHIEDHTEPWRNPQLHQPRGFNFDIQSSPQFLLVIIAFILLLFKR